MWWWWLLLSSSSFCGRPHWSLGPQDSARLSWIQCLACMACPNRIITGHCNSNEESMISKHLYIYIYVGSDYPPCSTLWKLQALWNPYLIGVHLWKDDEKPIAISPTQRLHQLGELIILTNSDLAHRYSNIVCAKFPLFRFWIFPFKAPFTDPFPASHGWLPKGKQTVPDALEPWFPLYLHIFCRYKVRPVTNWGPTPS